MTVHEPVVLPKMSAAVGVTVVWFLAAVLLGLSGAFETASDRPPVAIAVAAAGPPLLVVGLLIWSPRFHAWARSLDPRFLAMLQMWRIAGFAMLGLLGAGALPAGFAVPAGTGDVLVALTAPFVMMSASRTVYLAWTAFGILDLVLAVTLGTLHSSGPLGVLADTVTTDIMRTPPMSFIPTFGVPFCLAVHVISLVAVRNASRPVGSPSRVDSGGRG